MRCACVKMRRSYRTRTPTSAVRSSPRGDWQARSGRVALFLVALLEEVELELHRVSPGGDLARSHVRDEQFRPLLRHAGRDDAAPGMAEQDQWRARKTLVKLFGEIDPVGDELLARDAGRAVLRERSPRPTLVPLHENKVPLVRCVSRDERRLNVAGPAVQEQQYWISAIVAAYGDP